MLNDDFLNLFIDPLTWDKGSYKFNREEKDMRPYSVTNTKKDTIIVHNVLGIDKKDLKLTIKSSKEGIFLLIEGKTKDSLTEKEEKSPAAEKNSLHFWETAYTIIREAEIF